MTVDIGATKTVVAYTDGDAIEQVARCATDPDPTVAADAIVSALSAVREQSGQEPRAIGIGCPGPLDPITGTILEPPNLRDWWGFPLAEYVAERSGLPVAIENDANLGALGESIHGGGAGYRSLFYITLSTGIGAGYVVDGRIIGGHRALAGEIYAFDPGTFTGSPTGSTILELASGPGLVSSAIRRVRAGRRTVLEEAGLDTKALLAAADERDPVALETVEDGRNAIAALLVAVILSVAPEAIVLAGGLCTESRWFVDPIRTKIADWLTIDAFREIPVRRAELWDRAVLYGAAALVLESQ